MSKIKVLPASCSKQTDMLPLELYIHILGYLPACRLTDESIWTLLSCTEANWRLRSAALESRLWEPHYKVRYTFHNTSQEAERRESLENNYRLLYIERRRLDRLALQALENIVEQPFSTTYASNIGQLIRDVGYDIWDVLTIHQELNLPMSIDQPEKWLNSSAQEIFAGIGKIKPDLTKRFYAKEISGAMTRSEAIGVWKSLKIGQPDIGLEQSIAGLSAFWGIPYREILSVIDSLFEQCVTYLAQESVSTSASSDDYSVLKLCKAICLFMQEFGFGAVEHENFHDLYNNFPHFFLSEKKHSIPLSLVFVFVCLARRVGLNASPINTPQRVLARVACFDQGESASDIFLDIYNSTSEPIISFNNEVSQLLLAAGITPALQSPWTSATSPEALLIRSSHNIFASLRIGHHTQALYHEEQTAQYTATCVVSLFMENVQLIESAYHAIADAHPLDLAIIFRDQIVSGLDPEVGAELKSFCERTLHHLNTSSRDGGTIMHRPKDVQIEYFVGQVFVHGVHNYIGCITGWSPECSASEEWMMRMRVDELPRGRRQPFYDVIDIDGRRRLVAEENIRTEVRVTYPVHTFFKVFLERSPTCAKYFSDTELLCNADGSFKGRFVMNGYMRKTFPDDHDYGTKNLSFR